MTSTGFGYTSLLMGFTLRFFVLRLLGNRNRNLYDVIENALWYFVWVGSPAIARGAIKAVLGHRIQRLLREQLRLTGKAVCVNCGYDLTGNTTGVCPECGQQVE